MHFESAEGRPKIRDLDLRIGFGAPACYFDGGSAEGAGSVEALEFAEYERRSDTPLAPLLCKTGAANPNVLGGASTAAPVIGV